MNNSVYSDIISLIQNDDSFVDKDKHIIYIEDCEQFEADLPYVVIESLSILENGSKMDINDKVKLSLVRLVYRLGDLAERIQYKVKNFEELAKYASDNIYYVHAALGDRVATENEISSGIAELFTKRHDFIGENECKAIDCLAWAISGRAFFYNRTGRSAYNEQNMIKSFYDMLKEISIDLDNAMKLLSDSNKLYSLIAILRNIKKSGGYKYPSAAKDEIIPDIPIGSIANALKAKIKPDTTDRLYVTCLDIIRKCAKYKTNYSPKQVELLKKAYKILIEKGESNSSIQSKCIALLDAKQCGTLPENAFVFKIIDTVRARNYVYISQGQANIIEEEYRKLEIVTKTANGYEGIFAEKPTITNTILNLEESFTEEFGAEMKTLDLSDMLGKGLFNTDIMQI